MATRTKGRIRSNGQPLVIDSGGFQRAGGPAKRRMILSIDGLEKRGKDHFGLTMPGPLGIVSLDLGLDHVVQKFQDKKEVWVATHRIDITGLRNSGTLEEIAAEADTAWQNIMRDYYEILASGARSVMIDTATELWEILRIARFGKTDQVKPHHYGPVNAEFRDVIRTAFDSSCNVAFLHKMKAEYINDKTTGEYKRSGFSDMGFLVETIVQCWRNDEEKFPDCFHVTVTDCRQDPALNGFDMQGEQANFLTLATMAFPASVREDWE